MKTRKICVNCHQAFKATSNGQKWCRAEVCRAAWKAKRAAKDKDWRFDNRDRIAATSKRWRESNQELRTATRKAWYEANRAHILAVNKRWAQNNPDKMRALKLEWCQANPDRVRAHGQTWVTANRGKVNAKVMRRHVRKHANGVATDPGELADIAATYEMARILSDLTGIAFEVDHAVPIAKGGTHTFDNLQILTATHNRSKGGKLSHELARHENQVKTTRGGGVYRHARCRAVPRRDTEENQDRRL